MVVDKLSVSGVDRNRHAQAQATLRRLSLVINRRLDGLLHGDYLGLVPSLGSESAESREYRVGDDVRRMDWPVTARTTVPHVRQTEADRELETWICVDISASMDFGTARCVKRDLAVDAAAAFTYLTARGGNRVGLVASNGRDTMMVPARSGRRNAFVLLQKLVEFPRFDTQNKPATNSPENSTITQLVERLRKPPRRRGLAVVISDFISSQNHNEIAGWERSLKALQSRQDVIAVEIVDPRELELPQVGLLTVVDPETGCYHEIPTADENFRAAYAAAASQQRDEIRAALRRAGASHLRLRTDSDWVVDIVKFANARRRGNRQAGSV